MTFPHAIALAPAKLNLGLEVIGRREDGYHDILTVLQAVSLFDRFEWVPQDGTFDYVPPAGLNEHDDLIARALRYKPADEVWTGRLSVHKGIPVSAGLGGGSSDAALALRLSQHEAEPSDLAATASSLGSDVPFFLRGGTCLASGTGTTLEPLRTHPRWFVIVTPNLSIPDKTRVLYRSLTDGDFTDGDNVRELASMIDAGQRIATTPPNAFQRHLIDYSEVRDAREALLQAGAPWVSVSGAGPSVYCVSDGYRSAQSIAVRVPGTIGSIFVACSLPAQHGDTAAKNLALRLRGRIQAR